MFGQDSRTMLWHVITNSNHNHWN